MADRQCAYKRRTGNINTVFNTDVGILDGSGTMDDMPVKKGDHLLICADYGEMTLMGRMELIWSYVQRA